MNNKNIFQLVKENSEQTPNKVACIYQQQSITYEALITQVERLAAGLSKLGVKKGSKIALFCPNNLEFAYILLASAKLGAAVAPLPLTLQGQALVNAIEAADCEYAIAWSTVAKQLFEKRLVMPSKLIVLGNTQLETVSFSDLLNNELEEILPLDDVSSESPFILTMTSGSTGTPKPFFFTQDNKIKGAFNATFDY
jgi:long-chain acyl-CoA synthetase